MKYFKGLALALLLSFVGIAQAQTPAQQVTLCLTNAPTANNPLGGCTPITATNGLPVLVLGGGGVQAPIPPYPVPHASTSALGTSLVVKASPGNLFAYNCTAITGGAAGYCIAYNATTAPSTGALTGTLVLDFCYFDTTARGCSLSRIPLAANYSAGITILLTSAVTPYTYTTGTDTGAISADYQ